MSFYFFNAMVYQSQSCLCPLKTFPRFLFSNFSFCCRLFNSLLIFAFDVYTPTSHLSESNKTFFFSNFPILFERTRIHFRMFANYYDAYVTPSYTIQSSLRSYHRQSQFFVIFFTLCELRSAHYIATTLLDCSHFVLFFFKRQSPFCFFGHSTVDV